MMGPTGEQIDVRDVGRIKQLIMERLVARMDQVAGRADGPVIVRAEVPVRGIDAISWLCAQPPMARGYWSDRETDFELAGTGRADMVAGDSPRPYGEVIGILHRRLEAVQGNARYFGGFRFSEQGDHAACWDAFKAFRFILPRFELLRRDGVMTFACNMRSDDEIPGVEAELERLAFPSRPHAGGLPAPRGRADRPRRAEWLSLAEQTLEEIRRGDFQKLVLAREVQLTFDDPPAAPDVLSALKRHTDQRFHFCFQPHPQCAFVGASPERLYRRDARRLQTEAVAGTRPRGVNPEADESLRRELLQSEKERREHAYVLDGIRAALRPLVTSLRCADAPHVLALTHAQHLCTRLEGTLDEGVGDGDLLASLHPTAAVGGVPASVAMSRIAEREPFDRGWYAAPVGWIERDAAQFVVGIRSALLDHHRVHLFSGAGIVEGSDPVEEWDEIESKIGDFLSLFPLQ